MERRLISCLLFLWCVLFAAALSCNKSDNGDDDNDDTSVGYSEDDSNGGGVSSDDDDWVDDDTWGGCGGGDTVDDSGHPPEISGGDWEPTELELGNHDGTNYWTSSLYWSVCDTGNDLLGGGTVYFYLAGTTNQFLVDQPIAWEEFHSPPEIDLSVAGDCENPVRTHVQILFGEESSPPPAGDYCVDMESTDAAGSFSNLLEELCVTMPVLGD